MRGRELKHLRWFAPADKVLDAPYAGARIETTKDGNQLIDCIGCPLCGGEN